MEWVRMGEREDNSFGSMGPRIIHTANGAILHVPLHYHYTPHHTLPPPTRVSSHPTINICPIHLSGIYKA